MTGPLTISWLPEICGRVQAAPSLSVFLDFDGTLAPIVERPEDARLDSGMRGLLTALSERSGIRLAFVSGRALADLRQRIGIPRAVYAGNHGLEIEGMGLGFLDSFAADRQNLLARVCRLLAVRLDGFPGVELENKGLTATVHYRRADPSQHDDVARIVCVAAASGGSAFRVNAGNMVWEIVPTTNWHKGAAVRWINSRLAEAGAVSIYIGDDRTDESAFQQLPGEITICVGNPEHSSARYRVPDIEGVREFLSWLEGIR